MTTRKTATGRILTDADLDAIAEEVETSDYDIDTLRKRRRGRPAMGSGPAEVVPVRIDPELRAAVTARAETDGTTTSEVIREALRRFLDVKQAEQGTTRIGSPLDRRRSRNLEPLPAVDGWP